MGQGGQALERFTVELTPPAGGWTDLERTIGTAREAAVTLNGQGVAVHLLRTIFVPEDDACFLLYEGPSAEAVRAAVEAAALAGARVQECLVIPSPLDRAQPPTRAGS